MDKTELWGTFSVKDHLRGNKPFVAEVLLYDRLVIPRPTTLKEQKKISGKETSFTYWNRMKWNPEKLRRLLNILGKYDLAVELPWGEREREQWKNLYEGTDSEQTDNLRSKLAIVTKEDIEIAKNAVPQEAPFFATAGLISMYVAGEVYNKVARKLIALSKAPGVPIEPVIAYNSFADFENGEGLQLTSSDAMEEDSKLQALFGWEFFIPEDSDKNEYELLHAVAKIASRSDLREVRQYFHSWLKEMYTGRVDPSDAQIQMRKMLAEYHAIIRGSRLKTAVRFAAKTAPIIAPFAGLVGALAGAVAGSATSATSIYIEPLLSVKKPDERIRPASVVYDVRRFFGKTDI